MRRKAATSRSASQAERRRPSAEMFVDAARIRPQMTGNAAKRQRAIHKLPLPQGAGSLSVTSVPWVDFGDRKSVGSGQRVSVRVDRGGRRIIKKKIQD